MPQLDIVSFFNQVFWLFLIFFVFYVVTFKEVLPFVSRILKVRFKKTSIIKAYLNDSVNEQNFVRKVLDSFFSQFSSTSLKFFSVSSDFMNKFYFGQKSPSCLVQSSTVFTNGLLNSSVKATLLKRFLLFFYWKDGRVVNVLGCKPSSFLRVVGSNPTLSIIYFLINFCCNKSLKYFLF